MDELSRRDVIRRGSTAAAALAVGGLAACADSDDDGPESGASTTSDVAPSTPPSASGPGSASPTTSIAGRSDPTALAAMIEGEVLLPDSPGYPMSSLPWNLAYRDIRPAAIMRPGSVDDVATTVAWAREEGVNTVVFSGGHSYGGYSTTDGLLIDLQSLGTIAVDESSGRVDLGGGALLGGIDDQLAARNLTVPSGRCPTVGVAGLVLGGGFGFSARRFGLTSDSLIETQLVTASGELVTVSATENPELFWALQGGGGGNFGINVSFAFQGREVDQVSVFELGWSGFDGADALWSAAQEAALAGPARELSMELGVSMGIANGVNGPATDASVQLLGQYFGPEDELRDILSPVLATPPSSQFIAQTSFAASTSQLLQNAGPDAFLTKSNFLAGPIADDGIAELIDQMRRFPSESRAGSFKIFTWGGAISDVEPTATAFVHRNDAFVNEGSASWRLDSPQSVVDATTAWIEELYERMDPYLLDRSYQNFIDPTLDDWEEAYYGENLARLIEVKRRYDPDDYWRFAQSIPVA